MSMLTIRGLGKAYGETVALRDLDLDILPGSRTVVVGPSGSGKTTLLRIIAGFESPDRGELRLGGDMIANAEGGVPAHKRNIGLVMQEGALFPHLSIVDNIRFGIADQRDSRKRALELMDMVELDRSMADRAPHQLSGGQQQRVALARALARRPRLMLLDEPFSALDTGLREQLREATARILAEAGIATLLVTHDREEAMSFADQLVVLRQGQLIQAGSPRQLYLQPADAQTAGFLGATIILDAIAQGGRMRCALGDLMPSSAPQDDRAAILVRPEQIAIGPVLEGSDQQAWTVDAVRSVGSMTRLRLTRTYDDAPVSLDIETATWPSLTAGSRANLSVMGEVHVLPRGSAEV